MREGAHAHDVAVVLPRDGGDLDDAARHLGLRDGAETVALGGGDGGFAGIALTPEGRAHDEAVVDADRRLQGAADQAEGEDGGQHRAEQPAQADAAPVRRALGDVARVERIVVAEVDGRPKRASSLQRWQAGSPSPKQFSRTWPCNFDGFVTHGVPAPRAAVNRAAGHAGGRVPELRMKKMRRRRRSG